MSWRKKSSTDWLRSLPGVTEDEPLASRTSFGIGGPADFFVETGRVAAMEKMLTGCLAREIPYTLLGQRDARGAGRRLRLRAWQRQADVGPGQARPGLPHLGPARRIAQGWARHRGHRPAEAGRRGGGQAAHGQADRRAQRDAADQD